MSRADRANGKTFAHLTEEFHSCESPSRDSITGARTILSHQFFTKKRETRRKYEKCRERAVRGKLIAGDAAILRLKNYSSLFSAGVIYSATVNS